VGWPHEKFLVKRLINLYGYLSPKSGAKEKYSMLDINKRSELCCAVCGKPLVAEATETKGRLRLIGCGRNCQDVYDIPDGSVFFGLEGAPQFLYGPAVN
jgi:hypothetical protein